MNVMHKGVIIWKGGRRRGGGVYQHRCVIILPKALALLHMCLFAWRGSSSRAPTLPSSEATSGEPLRCSGAAADPPAWRCRAQAGQTPRQSVSWQELHWAQRPSRWQHWGLRQPREPLQGPQRLPAQMPAVSSWAWWLGRLSGMETKRRRDIFSHGQPQLKCLLQKDTESKQASSWKCEKRYLPLGFGKVLLYLSANTVLNVLVWGRVARNPKQVTDCCCLVSERKIFTISCLCYHSCAMASCAVSRWSWSTSSKDATKFLAVGKKKKNLVQ